MVVKISILGSDFLQLYFYKDIIRWFVEIKKINELDQYIKVMCVL